MEEQSNPQSIDLIRLVEVQERQKTTGIVEAVNLE